MTCNRFETNKCRWHNYARSNNFDRLHFVTIFVHIVCFVRKILQRNGSLNKLLLDENTDLNQVECVKAYKWTSTLDQLLS